MLVAGDNVHSTLSIVWIHLLPEPKARSHANAHGWAMNISLGQEWGFEWHSFFNFAFMINNKLTGNKPQTGEEIKVHLPEKNATTDSAKNTASQTPGLNQEKTTKDNLLPSDGDNLTV